MKLTFNDNKVSASLSVRELVGFVCRSGSLSESRSMNSEAMGEGRALHRALQQKMMGEMNNYAAEVRMSISRLVLGVGITLSGIADGVFFKDGVFTVDEIKSVFGPSDAQSRAELERHLAQAKCYALMLCESRRLEKINVRICYVFPNERKTDFREYCFTRAELSEFYHRLLCEFIDIAGISAQRIVSRRTGAEQLRFPFKSLRKGQKELISETYAAIKAGHNLYASAPTGIGKTVSVIYPAVKALGKGRADKIFYLTPKGSIQRNAEEAIMLMQKDGVYLKSITVSAKKKMCIDKSDCDCDNCQFAEGYYDRVSGAKKELLAKKGHITSEDVLEVGRRHKVCPFELSLDASLVCDFIVCDYNYVFDPKVSLKRFSDKSEKYIVLVDEAHNLIERVRESYSASVAPEDFTAGAAVFANNRRLKDKLEEIYSAFGRKKKELSEGDCQYISFSPPEDLTLAVSDFARELSSFIERSELMPEPKKILTDLFFHCRDFVMAYERYDSSFSTVFGPNGETRIYLVDPSGWISDTVNRWGVGIFFSATLLPQEYCFRMLGGDQARDIFIDIPSPFDSANFPVIARNISTKFNRRGDTVREISDLVHSTLQKTGNYMVFFPSYEYMKSVFDDYSRRYKDAELLAQHGEMSADERRKFLGRFTSETGKTSLIGFAVLGGAFSEGIDLVGDALSGVIIVGVGLPPPSAERESVSYRFSELELDGRAIAYVYPGFNKVLQAAGRVIRSESDRGFLVLCDERFTDPEYMELYPSSFENFTEAETDNEVASILYDFWH